MKALGLVGCVLLSLTASAQQFVNTRSVNLPDSAVAAKVEWVDLDNDGLLDIFAFATLSSGKQFFIAYKGDTINGFDFSTAQLTGFNNAVYRLADFDSDNDIDVIVSGTVSNAPRTSFFENQSDFNFAEHSSIAVGGSFVHFSDLNSNGSSELIVSGHDNSGSFLNIYQFHTTWNLVHDSLKIEARSIEIFDFDGDSHNDIFLSGIENNNIITKALWNQGRLYFKPLTPSKVASGNTSVGDLNHDGKLDVFLTGIDPVGNNRSIQYLNHGNVFIAKDTLAPLANGRTFLADFNSDGQCDIQVSGNTPAGDTLNSILTSQSSPVMVAKTKLHYQTFGDYDRDGDLDILQVQKGVNAFQLRVWRNDVAVRNEGPRMAKGAFGFIIFNKLFLHWGRGMDDHTPESTITYDVTMHIEQDDLLVGEFDLLSNKRLTVTHGNAGSRNYFILKPKSVSSFRYSVQAIDNSFETIGVPSPSGGSGVCTGTGEACESLEIATIDACKNESITLSADFGAEWFSLSKGFLAGGLTYEMTVTEPDTVFSFAPDYVKSGCPSLKIFLINVQHNFVRKTNETRFVCEGQSIKFNENSSWANILWKSQGRGNLGSTPEITYIVSQPDTVTLQVSDEFGCGKEHKTALRVSKPLISLTGDSYQILRGETVQLSVSGGETYSWTPAESLDNSTSASPIASPLASTLFSVTATDSIGCTDTGNVQVLVEGTAFIPNLFTPNDDGKNDEVKVYGLPTVSNFSFVIHNREGSVLYETKDAAHVSASGWDGTVNGIKQPAGVYYWKVKGEHASGRKLLLNGKTTGSIVLIR